MKSNEGINIWVDERPASCTAILSYFIHFITSIVYRFLVMTFHSLLHKKGCNAPPAACNIACQGTVDLRRSTVLVKIMSWWEYRVKRQCLTCSGWEMKPERAKVHHPVWLQHFQFDFHHFLLIFNLSCSRLEHTWCVQWCHCFLALSNAHVTCSWSFAPRCGKMMSCWSTKAFKTVSQFSWEASLDHHAHGPILTSNRIFAQVMSLY